MRIFLRTFNNKINSKTGAPLPEGQYRGTPEWISFQKILITCLAELGHQWCRHEEHPFKTDDPLFMDGSNIPDKRIYVHQTKRDKPEGDLFWMQMHMCELFTIDTNGWGADHSDNSFLPTGVDFKGKEATFCKVLSEELLASGKSKIDQPLATDNTPEKFILVPMQIPRDYTIKHHSPITVRYFIDSLMAWAEESQTHICIKMHPFNKVDTDLQMAVSEGECRSEYVHKVEGNIHELIKRSSGLFVINSGTGFESLVHGKPVCTFGQCDYSKVSFNADIRRIDEARDFILSYPPEFELMGYEFVHWYWTKHAYSVNAPDTKYRLTEYLKGVL